MAHGNNVTRMLDAKKIAYEAYGLPEEKLGAREVADILGVPSGHIFKTIVIGRKADKNPLLVVVPGDAVVDLKLVANAVNEKKVHLPSEREAERLTDLQAGGISPLALINKGFKVLIDSSAQLLGEIYISGGQRGLTLRLQAADLSRLTGARFARVAVPENPAATTASSPPSR